ncbi:MAG: HD domain-containing protein [Bacillota bacterium]
MNKRTVLTTLRGHIHDRFSHDTSGHNYDHMIRVSNMSTYIAKQEGLDPFLPEVIALTHDYYDDKLVQDPVESKHELVALLKQIGFDSDTIDVIINAIDVISFRHNKAATTLLQQVVKDSDRLDAIGAIGIIRTIQYGTTHNRSLDETIAHFDDKLFHLKDLLHTKAAQTIAEERHQLMRAFYDGYYKERDFFKHNN